MQGTNEIQGPGKKDARYFRHAKQPTGYCANCVLTQFLYNTYPTNMIIDEAGPELLLKPGVGDALVQSGIMGASDMRIEEVNWQNIVEHWELPVEIKLSPINPYRMGDSPHSYKHRPKGAPRPNYLDRFRQDKQEEASRKAELEKLATNLVVALRRESAGKVDRQPKVRVVEKNGSIIIHIEDEPDRKQ